MCGRYTFSETVPCEELEKIIASVQRSKPAFLQKSAEINPGDTAPIYFYKEGFRNPWKKGVIINARAETAASKQIFSPSLHSRRCVIPSAGFYEWSREKQKYLYTLSGSPLYMGGLYTFYEDGPRFLILTVPANSSVSPVHPRMPLLLPKEQIRPWLLGTPQPELRTIQMEEEPAQLCLSSV